MDESCFIRRNHWSIAVLWNPGRYDVTELTMDADELIKERGRQ